MVAELADNVGVAVFRIIHRCGSFPFYNAQNKEVV
jgi:hypothetical protein